MRNYRHIEVNPVSGALGAEIAGVDMSKELDDEVVSEVRHALLDHLVIFLRDQKVTPAQQVAFAKRFGQPIEYPQLKGLPEAPMITPVFDFGSVGSITPLAIAGAKAAALSPSVWWDRKVILQTIRQSRSKPPLPARAAQSALISAMSLLCSTSPSRLKRRDFNSKVPARDAPLRAAPAPPSR